MRPSLKVYQVPMTTQIYLGLRCNDCQSYFEEDRPLMRCPKCAGLLDTVFDEEALRGYSKLSLNNANSSMWSFNMFLPTTQGFKPITAGEGATPLRNLRSFSKNLLVKDETRNPTGCFKDRGASAAVTRLSQMKIRRLVLASEGNAGCSFALYSRMAGMSCHVFLPKQANPSKVQLSKKLGARATQVVGTIADAGRAATRESERTGDYNASTFVTPFRHDGKGTMALEICEQLGWKAPDCVVYPVGGGVGLVGMWKMFKILHRIGWINRKPRIIAVQPSGCAPIVDAYNHRREDVQEWKKPRTIANGLKIPKPLAGRWILNSLRESKGIALKVTDSQIRKAMSLTAKHDGIVLEPSSAATLAAIPMLYETRQVDSADTTVVIATGSGLKTIEQM